MLGNMRLSAAAPWILFVCFLTTHPVRGDEPLRAEATAALDRAISYYRGQVASRGGYVYYYSLDLKERWGEGQATADQVWVQPPGTPTVGLALLEAFEATGDPDYLEAATQAAEALVYGQLESGGWTNAIDFDPRGTRVALYRNGKGRGKNNSTLDDGISQAAIQFLARVDRALGFKNQAIHGASLTALDALLKAQFPNGAFPQVWTGPVEPRPIVPARFPEYDWRTEGRIKNYWNMYTLNDNLAGHVVKALEAAHQVYGDAKYLDAIRRFGDFLILAQLPEPQPAWAQQYNADMEPIWARRFEPAAVTSSESQDVLEALLTIHRITGDPKYLGPIAPALAYLERSLLSDGRLSRYYELRTNRPLYMTRKGDNYTLTYDDSKLPDHYGWKIEPRLAKIKLRLQVNQSPAVASEPDSVVAEDEVRRIIDSLDDQGRWISTYTGGLIMGQPPFKPGYQYIGSDVFASNVKVLAAYLKRFR